MKTKIEYIKKHYIYFSQYDLTTDLLCDSIFEVDDVEEIKKVMIELFIELVEEDVLSAINNFQE
jgi:hypothetical protein